MTVDNETSDQQVIFATGGYDHTIKLWQPHTGNCERTFTETEFVSFYLFLEIISLYSIILFKSSSGHCHYRYFPQ